MEECWGRVEDYGGGSFGADKAGNRGNEEARVGRSSSLIAFNADVGDQSSERSYHR